MKCFLTCLVVSTLAFSACGEDAPDAVDNGNVEDAGVPPPSDDAGSPGDSGHDQADAGWKPGQKIPANAMWNSGSDGSVRVWAKMFGDFRGRPTTSSWINLLWVPPEWLMTPGLLYSLSGEEKDQILLWDEWRDFKGVLALSMSMAGTSEQTQAEYDQHTRECANGDYDDNWRTFARNAKAAGRTGDNTVISLAQEFNGTWFPWNPKTVGIETWKNCWKHVYTAIHLESDLKVVWSFSATANTTLDGDYAVANIQDAYPGDDFVDVLGLSRYDYKALGPKDRTDWRDTCGNDQDICAAAQYARDHGKKLAVVEWSVQRDELGWGDNPNFVQMMFGFFADNRDILLLENNFNHYGDEAGAANKWNLFPRAADNAMSSDKYRELYTP
jgi:hypothetical protein